jgi:flagellar basal-body rod modification protein FlgD
MQITNGITAGAQGLQTAGASTGSRLDDKDLGKDAFLKLLVAQLRNQNPLNPLQGTDFIAQTAQFTSLEQLQQINQSLAKLASPSTGAGNTSLDAALAAGYIGKVVTANGTVMELGGGSPATLHYSLPGAAAVTIDVIDLQGNSVRTLQLGAQPAGQGAMTFDGLGDDGRLLPSGRYLYTAKATDAAGRNIAGVGTASGLVTDVAFDGTQPLLIVDGHAVPLSAVSLVSMASQG